MQTRILVTKDMEFCTTYSYSWSGFRSTAEERPHCCSLYRYGLYCKRYSYMILVVVHPNRTGSQPSETMAVMARVDFNIREGLNRALGLSTNYVLLDNLNLHFFGAMTISRDCLEATSSTDTMYLQPVL